MAHKDQFRKGTNVPYIMHLFEVAQILTANGASDNVICAGILHDTLEDTTTHIEDIVENFGQEIADLVASESENKALSWEERKQYTIDHLGGTASLEELQVACADKLSNIRSLEADLEKCGDEVWTRFKRGYNKQKWYYCSLVNSLKVLKDYDMYQEFVKICSELFSK
ncbi:MAG: HD domain-containing protein [Clostridia bacterium]